MSVRSWWPWPTLPVLAGLALGAWAFPGHARAAFARATARRPDNVVTLSSSPRGRAIPSGFIGVSFEYWSVLPYTGSSEGPVNPVLVNLLRGLAPSSGATIRIGGDSADRTWWPIPGRPPPPGIAYSLSPGWISAVRNLADAVPARLILGINLEAGSQSLAQTEADGLLSGLGRPRIAALEIGNEPELYPVLPYRVVGGKPVPGRPPGYNWPDFAREFSRFQKVLPQMPLADPATGQLSWLALLPAFLKAEPALRQVTFHRYPLSHCVADSASPRYPTVPHLLSRLSSRGLTSGIARAAGIAHRFGRSFRVDELNSVTCQGRAGVSNTFASSLWILDTLFALASAGVDAVNIHTWTGANPNQLFTFRQHSGQWIGTVRPLYYGLLAFARAAPPGSRLLRLRTAGPGTVRAWATLAPDHRVRVVLINDSLRHPESIGVRVAGAVAGGATLERLSGPSAYATSGITLGGQSFGTETGTGTLSGAAFSSPVEAHHGYSVRLPAASAALLTIGASPS